MPHEIALLGCSSFGYTCECTWGPEGTWGKGGLFFFRREMHVGQTWRPVPEKESPVDKDRKGCHWINATESYGWIHFHENNS